MLPVRASITSSGPVLLDGLEDDLLLDSMFLFFSCNSPLGVDFSPTSIPSKFRFS